jgi:hypothetical protein
MSPNLSQHVPSREICGKARYDIDSLANLLRDVIVVPIFLVRSTDHVSSFPRCLAAQSQAMPDLLAPKATSMM